MKIANFFIGFSGIIILLVMAIVGLLFITDQEIPQGVSWKDPTLIQSLVNIVLGFLVIKVGVNAFNSCVDSMRKGREKCLEQEMVS